MSRAVLTLLLRNGVYVVAYRLSQPSTYEIDVSMVTGTGLIGCYYANETSFKEGVPAQIATDEQINFNIRRLDDTSLFSHIIWTGYLSFPHTSDFEFEVTGVEGSLKLWIGDELVLNTDKGSIRGNFRSIMNIIYEVKIEYALVRSDSFLFFTYLPILGDLIDSASRIVMDQLIGYQPPLAPAILVVKKNGKKYSSYSSFVQLISTDSRIASSSYSHPVTMDYGTVWNRWSFAMRRTPDFHFLIVVTPRTQRCI
jgi:hypothetical protein